MSAASNRLVNILPELRQVKERLDSWLQNG